MPFFGEWLKVTGERWKVKSERWNVTAFEDLIPKNPTLVWGFGSPGVQRHEVGREKKGDSRAGTRMRNACMAGMAVL